MNLEEQFSRLIQVLQLIEKEPWQWDVAALEERFAVSRATIERDIAILRGWGTIKRKDGKFGLAEMKFLPTTFTPLEALALRIAVSTFAEQAGAAYKDALEGAQRKIDIALPAGIVAEANKAQERVDASPPLVREFSPATYQDLQRAILRHHPVDITYSSRSQGQPTKRRVDPYGLTFRFGAWYLVGYCHLREGLRTFALDRIKWLRIAEDYRFRYPADFDLQAHLAQGWQLGGEGEREEVVVRFAPKRAQWIAGSQWHPTQKIEHEEGGSILFRVTVAGYEEMIYWILSFGGDAEVVLPDALRLTVAAEAKRMADSYGVA